MKEVITGHRSFLESSANGTPIAFWVQIGYWRYLGSIFALSGIIVCSVLSRFPVFLFLLVAFFNVLCWTLLATLLFEALAARLP
jgi:hypothetical protein